MAEDLFSTESGLIDDFDFTITEAYFAPDAQYMDGQVLLIHLVGTTDDPDNPEQHLMIPVGNGWSSMDGGKTAIHERGKKKFMSSSVYGRMINRCIDELGMKDIFLKRGSPELGFTEAAIWLGLKLHMKREKLEFGSGLKPTERLMPVAFLGEVGKPGMKATAKKKAELKVVPKPEPTPAESEPTEAERAEDNADLEQKVVMAKVKALAKKCSDYDEFYAEALKLPKVKNYDDIIAAIIDPDAIWAEVHGA